MEDFFLISFMLWVVVIMPFMALSLKKRGRGIFQS